MPTPSVLKQTLFNLLSSRLILNLLHAHSHTHYSPLYFCFTLTETSSVFADIHNIRKIHLHFCVLVNKASHFCFPLQWLDNCRKTFGDKDSIQRPNAEAQVERNTLTHLPHCMFLFEHTNVNICALECKNLCMNESRGGSRAADLSVTLNQAHTESMLLNSPQISAEFKCLSFISSSAK